MSVNSKVVGFTPPDPDSLSRDVAASLVDQRRRADLSWLSDNPDAMGVPFTWARNFPAVKPPKMIVHNLLEAGSLACMYGDSNTGKSTLALDIALALSRGGRWRDRSTARGIVLWLSLEAAAGTRRRVAAFPRSLCAPSNFTEPALRKTSKYAG